MTETFNLLASWAPVNVDETILTFTSEINPGPARGPPREPKEFYPNPINNNPTRCHTAPETHGPTIIESAYVPIRAMSSASACPAFSPCGDVGLCASRRWAPGSVFAEKERASWRAAGGGAGEPRAWWGNARRRGVPGSMWTRSGCPRRVVPSLVPGLCLLARPHRKKCRAVVLRTVLFYLRGAYIPDFNQ